jgi:uncharacterized glyoxalase superfamily protein PhnB
VALQVGPGEVLSLWRDYAVHDHQAIQRGRAVAAGATMVMPPTDQFYGERSCRLRDPFGHAWLLGHSIEKVDPEEMQRRYTAMMAR